MVSVAMAAVSKLLDEKATSKDDEEAIDKYIKEVKKSSWALLLRDIRKLSFPLR